MTHYFIIFILFRIVNLDHANYVTIVDNVTNDAYYAEQWRNFSNICYINIYSEICRRVCRKGVQKVELIVILLLCPSCLLNNLYQHS